MRFSDDEFLFCTADMMWVPMLNNTEVIKIMFVVLFKPTNYFVDYYIHGIFVNYHCVFSYRLACQKKNEKKKKIQKKKEENDKIRKHL